MLAGKAYKCSICDTSFGRVEHLKRHVKLHTGEKLYQCSCRRRFSRSDVFAQHLRKCEHAMNSDVSDIRASISLTRNKTACDQCAKAKVKCNSANPCERCSRRGLDCAHTRVGYQDMYGRYRADETLSSLPDDPAREDASTENVCAAPASLSFSQWPFAPGWDQGLENLPTNATESSHSWSPPNASLTTNPATIEVRTVDCTQVQQQLPSSSNCLNLDAPSDQVLQGNNNVILDALEARDFDSQTEDASWRMAWNDWSWIQNPVESPHPAFKLDRLDPLEALCGEIKKLLRGAGPCVSELTLTAHVTRENLVSFSQLFSRNFLRNMPVVHGPSFQLVRTPAALAAAIMIAGACFTDNSISVDAITELAMGLLKAIKQEPHETDMGSPPLSTLQASVITCAVLVCSRDEKACTFISDYLPMNSSMAKRAGIFASDVPVDYTAMTADCFDWQQWVEQETRRRLACEVFCHQVGGCIFLGLSPHISELNSGLILPCYESCWEAETGAECFKILQAMPPAIPLSQAMHRLRFSPPAEAPLIETSGFGMFVVIKAIHCLLSQATLYDREFRGPISNDAGSVNPLTLLTGRNITNFDTLLKQDLSGPTVATLADDVVAACGSPALKHINNALNSWDLTWHLRRFRELEYEESSFFQNPLPFWWLAKLYLLLHICNDVLPQNSEFAISRVSDHSEAGRMKGRAKMVRWLSRFRTPQFYVEPLASNILSKLAHVADDDRCET